VPTEKAAKTLREAGRQKQALDKESGRLFLARNYAEQEFFMFEQELLP
jgi:hypothetical protein